MSHSQPKKIEKRAKKIGDPGHDPQHYFGIEVWHRSLWQDLTLRTTTNFAIQKNNFSNFYFS